MPWIAFESNWTLNGLNLNELQNKSYYLILGTPAPSTMHIIINSLALFGEYGKKLQVSYSINFVADALNI